MAHYRPPPMPRAGRVNAVERSLVRLSVVVTGSFYSIAPNLKVSRKVRLWFDHNACHDVSWAVCAAFCARGKSMVAFWNTFKNFAIFFSFIVNFVLIVILIFVVI